MTSSHASMRVAAQGQVTVTVRYVECDPMGVAHHSVYPVWLEIARTEMLRQRGKTYKEIEAGGMYIVVAQLNLRYRRPAYYDDQLTVQVRRLIPENSSGREVKILHDYRIYRGAELLTEADTVLVCVDRAGRPMPAPPGLLD